MIWKLCISKIIFSSSLAFLSNRNLTIEKWTDEAASKSGELPAIKSFFLYIGNFSLQYVAVERVKIKTKLKLVEKRGS